MTTNPSTSPTRVPALDLSTLAARHHVDRERRQLQLPELRRSERVTGERREQLAARVGELYAAGYSLRELALLLNRSYGFVHRLLAGGDHPIRSRGGQHLRRLARTLAPSRRGDSA